MTNDVGQKLSTVIKLIKWQRAGLPGTLAKCALMIIVFLRIFHAKE